jgi:ABC-type uncharacterized transport system involved in gliding motility auxiliary subunit
MKNNQTLILWITSAALAIGLLFARVVYPEILWLTGVFGALLVGALGYLIAKNRDSLTGRSAAYGLNSTITVLLVLAIVGVINFVGVKYPKRLDLTENKVNTLSDQTVKVVQGIQSDVKAVLFFKDLSSKEKYRMTLDNYAGANPKFSVEYVDPNKEPTRVRTSGIRKADTLLLTANGRESKVEEPTEEKLTNALIKLLKDRPQTLCAVVGHGEKSFSSAEPEGLDQIKKGLESQSYVVRDLNLVQENQVPKECDAIAILGPTKAFFAPEIVILKKYLTEGGRALIALDSTPKIEEQSPEITALLSEFGVKPVRALIVDPTSQALGVDAAVPLLASYSKESPIAKEFRDAAYFPFARPLDLASPAPEGLKTSWIAQSTPRAWGETDIAQLSKGAVQFNSGTDRQGPMNVVVAVEGKAKGSTATRATRIVIFGSSSFVANAYARSGANSDLFLNSASWAFEEENLISIRAKEDRAGRLELSQKQGQTIFILTVIIIPLAIAIAGIVIWVLRRRL